MSIRDTLRWARTEWGIFAQRGQLSAADQLRWLGQWVPFATRTIAYGTFSVTVGALTPRQVLSAWAMRRWCRTSLRGLGIRSESAGAAHAPRRGGFMYAANHLSLLDILVLGAELPREVRWAAKRSLMRIPILGWHLRVTGHVPVERDSGKRGAADSIARFERVLREDKVLLIFPEGTRSPDGEVQEFKSGGFYAAVRAERPVVPVALDGTQRLMRKGAALIEPRPRDGLHRVRVAIGAPIHAPREGRERDRVVALRDRTRAAVVALLAELRRGSFPARPPADPAEG
jgi:1-acyl-sn-glycerol-3-phosphate acyltransferase